MATVQEVAVTSCLNDSVVSAYMWDVQTGTTLMTYRGESPVTAAGLSLLSAQYVVAALQDKPFLRVWAVNSQQPLSAPRMVCPGRVTHAQASPDSCYIAITVAEKLHTYQVGSGRLVGTGLRHFQPIRVLRWTADGTLVVTGGEDGLVSVWPLASLASQGQPEPRFVLSDHSLPVTDLAITGGSRPRLYSVSADRTCKIYDLCKGALLVSLVFDKMLTAVAVATLETDVFVGTDSGTILQWSLLSPPRHLEYHLTPEEAAPVFSGHSKAVRNLSVSLNGDVLMSSSSDSSVKIWHISSRQCLRTIAHKGPVTNAFFAPKPKQLFENELKPSVVLSAFHTASNDRSKEDCVDVITERTLRLCSNPGDSQRLFSTAPPVSSDDRVKSLQMEVDLLRSINSNLYKFTVDKVIAGGNVLPSAPTDNVKEQGKKRKKKRKSLVKGLNQPKTLNTMANSTSKKKRNRNKNKANKTN